MSCIPSASLLPTPCPRKRRSLCSSPCTSLRLDLLPHLVTRNDILQIRSKWWFEVRTNKKQRSCSHMKPQKIPQLPNKRSRGPRNTPAVREKQLGLKHRKIRTQQRLSIELEAMYIRKKQVLARLIQKADNSLQFVCFRPHDY